MGRQDEGEGSVTVEVIKLRQGEALRVDAGSFFLVVAMGSYVDTDQPPFIEVVNIPAKDDVEDPQQVPEVMTGSFYAPPRLRFSFADVIEYTAKDRLVSLRKGEIVRERGQGMASPIEHHFVCQGEPEDLNRFLMGMADKMGANRLIYRQPPTKESDGRCTAIAAFVFGRLHPRRQPLSSAA